MAKPHKKGIDYFSHDVDMMSDKKIAIVKAKHGLIGYAVYLRLLEEIYKDKGYYIELNEDFEYIFCDQNRIEHDVFKTLVNEYINRNLFNKRLLNDYNILTSARIQENYLIATARRKTVEIAKEYLLLENDNEYINQENVNICSLNVNNLPQSKVKEIESKKKVKDTVVKNDDTAQEIIDYFNSKSVFPSVRKLTQGRKSKINARLKEFSKDKIIETIDYATKSPFLKGETKEWKMTFDFMFKNNENMYKIIEGVYHNGKKTQNYDNDRDYMEQKALDGEFFADDNTKIGE